MLTHEQQKIYFFVGEVTGSDDAISSHAYEEAGQLSNPELVSTLIMLIEKEKR